MAGSSVCGRYQYHSRYTIDASNPLSLIISPQYGYHTSALNQIQAVLTCRDTSSPENPTSPAYGLPSCIPLTDAAFSVVTAIFTVGGLSGSLVANIFSEKWGRRGASRISALFFLVGSCIMGLASSYTALLFGRYGMTPSMTLVDGIQIPDWSRCWCRNLCWPRLPRRNFSPQCQGKSRNIDTTLHSDWYLGLLINWSIPCNPRNLEACPVHFFCPCCCATCSQSLGHRESRLSSRKRRGGKGCCSETMGNLRVGLPSSTYRR